MPDWYPLMRDAKEMGIHPWELLELPTFWPEVTRAFRAAEKNAAINLAKKR